MDRAKFEDYEGFVEKFKPKLTTDDCYTPPEVYDVVASFVEREYGVDRTRFVRPFWPGADYQSEEYPEGCVVVDNPPFSILSKIIDYYQEHGIRFFLFAPALSVLGTAAIRGVCTLSSYCQVVYDNGAEVNTSFVTNLEPDTILRSAPELRAEIIDAQKTVRIKKTVSKLSFQLEIITGVQCGYFSKVGIDFRVGRSDAVFVRTLDAMKDAGKKKKRHLRRRAAAVRIETRRT